MAKNSASDWMPRVLVESFLIVISILVALALDEWREQREDDAMVRQSLLNFVSEIQQNRIRIDDAGLFHMGLLNVMQDHYVDKDISSVDEFVNIIDSYSPVILQSTAWETGLATGSLANMEYNLVSALWMTYNMQNRYQDATASGMDDLIAPQNISPDQINLAVYNSVRYLGDVTMMEVELNSAYQVAESLIRTAIGEVVTPAGPDPELGAIN